MPEQMTIDEVNRYIHVELLGKCPHDKQTRIEYPPIYPKTENSGWDMKCDACGSVSVTIRNYCSDDSPRRLLNEVVAKVIEACGVTEMWLYFLRQAVTPFIEQDDAGRYVDPLPTEDDLTKLEATATAEQIARACVEAHKGSKVNA